MMKIVVAGLDGSRELFALLGQPAVWAKRMKAELRGVFVEDECRFVTYPTYSEPEGVVTKPVPLPDEDLKQVEQEVMGEGAEMRKRFESTAKANKLRPQFRLFRGRVRSVLAREAQGADMVVVGNRKISAGTQ